MAKPISSVLADALRLDDDARAELAAELLASLDGPAEPDAAAARDAEIDRRIEEIEAGRLALEPWDEVRRRNEREILGGEAVSNQRARGGTPRSGRLAHRRFALTRFPYTIVYRERETDIYIVAIAHTPRRPAYWKNRR